jgi:hypothetical protein
MVLFVLRIVTVDFWKGTSWKIHGSGKVARLEKQGNGAPCQGGRKSEMGSSLDAKRPLVEIKRSNYEMKTLTPILDS